MKGRFRKGKKAFKTGRHGKSFNRYVKFVIGKENDYKLRMQFAMKIMTAGMVKRMGMHQVALIQAQRGVDKLTKALKIAETVVHTAQATAKIFS